MAVVMRRGLAPLFCSIALAAASAFAGVSYMGNDGLGDSSVNGTSSVSFVNGAKLGADNDNLLFQSTNAAAGLLPIASSADVTAEASTRAAADTTKRTYFRTSLWIR
jgi:hypothetical protein